MTDDERQLAFERAIEPMEKKVDAAIEAAGMESVVIYSAYETMDSDDLPIDNLDEVATEGFVVFRSKKNRYFGGQHSKTYWSPVLFHPTWLEVTVLANAAILRTRDYHHCFFEGIEEAQTSSLRLMESLIRRFGKDVKIYNLYFGR